ncbi:MAG: hypothetical protein V4516_09310 [Pseudomonadota bacterium]
MRRPVLAILFCLGAALGLGGCQSAEEKAQKHYISGLAMPEAAARALPDDALVQLHLGLTYLAPGQSDAARPLLQKALALAGDSPLPAFAAARAEPARLAPP